MSTIWRESTTDIVPVGSRRKSSRVRPKRVCTSSTAVERSGPIWAGLFTPRAEIEWQTKQPVFTNQAPGPSFIRCSASFSSAVCGSVRGTPGTNEAGTGALRQDSTSMARACASFVLKLKLGMTVSWTRARGSLRCATCQAKVGLLAREPAVVVLLGRLVAHEGEVGADRAARGR